MAVCCCCEIEWKYHRYCEPTHSDPGNNEKGEWETLSVCRSVCWSVLAGWLPVEDKSYRLSGGLLPGPCVCVYVCLDVCVC